jgi:hypothetical protein
MLKRIGILEYTNSEVRLSSLNVIDEKRDRE